MVFEKITKFASDWDTKRKEKEAEREVERQEFRKLYKEEYKKAAAKQMAKSAVDRARGRANRNFPVGGGGRFGRIGAALSSEYKEFSTNPVLNNMVNVNKQMFGGGGGLGGGFKNKDLFGGGLGFGNQDAARRSLGLPPLKKKKLEQQYYDQYGNKIEQKKKRIVIYQ